MTTLGINTIPVARGGGLTATLNMLHGLASSQEELGHIAVYVRRGSTVSGIAGLKTIELPAVRVAAERRLRSELQSHPVDVLFSAFGAPLFRPPSRVIGVANCAYSNLFYPEIDFWRGLDQLSRRRAQLIDHIRRSAMLRSTVVTLESRDLLQRARSMFGDEQVRFEYLPPARDPHLEEELAQLARERQGRRRKLLFFSGHHINKNWELLPGILRHLTPEELRNISVTFTAELSDGMRLIAERIHHATPQVEVACIGRVSHACRAKVLRDHDALCLLSTLESFSNNLYEAWAADLPLVIADAAWARSEVGDAALFAPLGDSETAADRIRTALFDSQTGEHLVARGRARLALYPTHIERVTRVLELARAQ